MDVTTWEAMILQERGLRQLEDDIDAYLTGATAIDEHTADTWSGIGPSKPRLVALVGWHARFGCLQSQASYDVAYQRLYYDKFGAVEYHVEAAR